MFIDARSVPARSSLETDVCIVGAGPAGITLAREFNGQPFRVMLLEGGGLEPDRDVQALYQGENVGLHHVALDEARSRFFGGSSNRWGGFSRPLDAHDFETREWIPNSGWPIQRADLEAYYERAHPILQLGPSDYDLAAWEKRIGRSDAKLVAFDHERAVNKILQFSPPTRFGQLYRDEIARSQNVSTYLNANVTEIETPDNGSNVSCLKIRTLAGGEFRVVARTYILAAGGIETPRLLLASNRYQRGGVGNLHDLVGRYFMDHPRLRSGEILFHDARTHSAMYDVLSAYTGGSIVARGVKVGGYFSLSTETQRAEKIGNTRCYVKSSFIGDGPATDAAVTMLIRAIHERGYLRDRSKADVMNFVTHLPQAAVFIAAIKFKLPFLVDHFMLETIVEPTPMPDSRVVLGTERDALGVPRVRVNWQLGEIEKRAMRRTQEILGEELERAAAGSVSVDAPREREAWPDELVGCWHHMGTTRMHNDPRKGVVDVNCRVHGMDNLYVAGSSVFPTSGADFPTITVVALALRMADHIKTKYGQ